MNALDRMPLFVWDRKVAFIEAGAGVLCRGLVCRTGFESFRTELC